MAILSAESMCFATGHVALLDHADFQLDLGEKIGLIGRNGVGKSSLLKILAEQQPLDEGRIARQSGLKTVYVPQEPEFNHQLTVFETVAQGLGELRQVLMEYHQLSQRLSGSHDDALMERFDQLQIEIETLNGWQFDTLVHRTLTELNLAADARIEQLSGGQKKRVALAQAWVQKPDILLLDEPTNHLDIQGIIWLESLLQQFSGSLIVITHDRRFLDNIASRIVELDRGQLRSYPGSFSQYRTKKEQELQIEAEHNRLFDKFHAQEEIWIRKGIEARRTRNEGRVRRLEELRKQRVERRERQGQVRFTLDSGERSGKLIAELDHVSFAYGEHTIIQDFSAVIQRGDKVGLIGANGIGKTTFLKLILGELAPTSGKIRLGSRQEVAYFDQFRSVLNEEDTVFYTLGQGNDYVEVGGEKRHVMGYLTDFLFHPARANSPVKSLSGGERNRLLLAKLFTRRANILVLDEPTNDLDIDTQELLENLLRDYRGTVFLVSHDRMFLDQVITQSIVFEGSGSIREYIGGYQDYEDAKRRELQQKPTITAPSAPQHHETAGKVRHKTRNKLSYHEQRELNQLPDIIDELEHEQAKLAEQLSQPDIFKQDYQQAIIWQQRMGEIEEELLEKLERWTLLEAKVHDQ